MDNHNIDHDREDRIGFQEVVYGESKSIQDLLNIVDSFIHKDKNVLITKLQKEKATVISQKYSDAFYDQASGIFILNPVKESDKKNEVAIISAGTSDLHVVNETFFSLKFMGIHAERIHDVGVSGVHRLMSKIDHLKTFKILIVIAGFEGALPTVIGGLLPQPIIAVPTNVGYGVAKGGQVALNAMLSSCANGISVVNINNGYGAAMSAVRILNLVNKSLYK